MKKAIFILFILFFYSCSTNRVEVKQVESKKGKKLCVERKYLEFVGKGDYYFQKKNLFSWRQVIDYYYKAFKIKEDNKLMKKVILAFALEIVREKHELIISNKYLKLFGKFNFVPADEKERIILNVLESMKGSVFIRNKKVETLNGLRMKIDKSVFDLENSDIDSCFYLLSLKRAFKHKEYLKSFELLSKRFSTSPLFIYLNNFNTKEDIGKKYPNFAEYCVKKAYFLFKRGKSPEALKYFERALKLIPDYVKAYTGAASVWFFFYEVFSKAMEYYNLALKYDRKNPTALLGKGVCLQKLKKYDESTTVLDNLLMVQALYHGEAYYYKAYNFLYKGDLEEANKQINLSKLYLPDSGDVNFLSGLINLKEGNLRNAEEDFLKSLEDDSFKRCEPYFYIGKIKSILKKKKYGLYFGKFLRCIEKKRLYLRAKALVLVKKNSMDFDKRMELKKLKRKITSFKKTSVFLLKEIMSVINFQRKYIKLKKNVLVEIKKWKSCVLL